jgi:hypothetical protein
VERAREHPLGRAGVLGGWDLEERATIAVLREPAHRGRDVDAVEIPGDGNAGNAALRPEDRRDREARRAPGDLRAKAADSAPSPIPARRCETDVREEEEPG